jgi:hypothetical protein
MREVSVPVAWYRRDDWLRWRTFDSQLQPYDKWLGRIEEAIKQLEQRGHSIDKVIMDPDEFLTWCQASGRNADRDAWNAYVAVLLSRRQRDGH